MSQPAPIEQLAEVLHFDDFAFANLSPDERAVMLARRAAARLPSAPTWASLLGANLSDARDGAAIVARLGGHPIAVHGVRLDGTCTCGRAACDAIGKHPVSPRWQSEALDLVALDELLQERPGLGIGWRQGVQPDGSRLVTVDVDGGLELLEPLVQRWGPLPETLTAETGRGGRHLLFRVAPDAPEIRNRRGVAPKVDIRGEGGMVVVAPSRHASGRRYRWLRAVEPAVLP